MLSLEKSKILLEKAIPETLATKKAVELEASIGTFIVPINESGRYSPYISKTEYETLINFKNIVSSKKEEIDYSVTIYDTNSKENIRTIFHIKDKASQKIHQRKENIFKIDGENLPFRIRVSSETPLESVDGKGNEFKFRKRTSKYHISGLWRLDFSMLCIKKMSTSTHLKAITDLMILFRENPDATIRELEKKGDVLYELEVEYIGDSTSPIKVYTSLLDIITLLLAKIGRYETHDPHVLDIYAFVRDTVGYQKFAHLSSSEIELNKFLNMPVTLEIKNLEEITKDCYSITEKADGDVVLVEISEENVCIVDNTNKIIMITKSNKNIKGRSIVIGEYIDAKKTVYLFDILVHNDADVTQIGLKDRYKMLSDFTDIKELKVKEFQFPGSPQEFYSAVSKFLGKTKTEYHTDGLIFTPQDKSYYNANIYKWKPPSQNSIDFMITIDSIDKVKKSVSLSLYTGIREDKISSIVRLLKNQKFERLTLEEFRTIDGYIPFLFVIPKVTENTYSTFLKYTDHNAEQGIYTCNGIPIQDKTIVEFVWSGREWTPIRFRNDKTTKLRVKGNEFGNNYMFAKKIWETIVNPITQEMLEGKEKKEGYWASNVDAGQIMGLKKFHGNIKRQIYSKYASDINFLIEIAGGRANDVRKWVANGVKKVLVIDLDKEAIKEGEKRVAEVKEQTGSEIEVSFLQADINELSEEQLQLEEQADVIMCNFAIHYFTRDRDTILHFYELIDAKLKDKGYFIFMTLDGRKVFGLLEGLKKGETYSFNKGGDKLFSIRKEYETTVFKKWGQQVSIFVESIGFEHPEYLVNFESIKKDFFKDYKVIEDRNFEFMKTSDVKMSEAEKNYSFLNRYCVLQK